MTRQVLPFPLRTASPDLARARAQVLSIERAVRWRVRLWRARRRLPEVLLLLLAGLAACAVGGL